MIKKNFQLAEPVIGMLKDLAGAYGKKSDGLIVTAGLMLLKELPGEEFAKAVANAHKMRYAISPESKAGPPGARKQVQQRQGRRKLGTPSEQRQADLRH